MCPFEQDVFEAAVEAELADAMDDSPMSIHLAHHGAMLCVMVWRAANAMNAQPLVCGTPTARPLSQRLTQAGYKALNLSDDELERYGAQLANAKINPYLDAFTRLSREYERWRRYMLRHRQQRVYEMKHNIDKGGAASCRDVPPASCRPSERSGMAFQAMDHGQDARATSGEAPACHGEAGDAGLPPSAVAGVPTEPPPPTERSERLNNNQPRSDRLIPAPRGEGRGQKASQPKAADTAAKSKSKKRSRRGTKRKAKPSPNQPSATQPCILDDPRVAEIIRKAEANRDPLSWLCKRPPPRPG